MKFEGRTLIALALCTQACGVDDISRLAEYPPVGRTETGAAAPKPAPPRSKHVQLQQDPGQQASEESDDPALADAPAKPLGPDEIRILIYSRPLRADAVRLDAIDKFLLLYAPYAANKALLRQTAKALRVARAYLRVSVSAIPLSSTPLADIAPLLKDPCSPASSPCPGRYFFSLGAALMNVVSLTKNVIGDFYEQVRDMSPGGENLIWEQIGRRPDDTSIASSNIDYLTTWMNTRHN